MLNKLQPSRDLKYRSNLVFSWSISEIAAKREPWTPHKSSRTGLVLVQKLLYSTGADDSKASSNSVKEKNLTS